MGLLNWNSAGVLISDEPVYGIDANPVHLLHDTLYNHTGHKIEIYTAASKGGTKLTESTDYSVGDEDTDLTADAGNPVYQTVTILNSAYHEATLGGPLYFYYETVGDYVDAEDVKPRIIEKTADFTVRNTVHDLIYLIDATTGDVTVSNANPTASLHAGIRITFIKTDSSANIVDGLPGPVALPSQGNLVTYLCDGTTWHIPEMKANYDSGWVDISGNVAARTITITHNLGVALEGLIAQVFVEGDDGKGLSGCAFFNLDTDAGTATSRWGQVLLPVDTNTLTLQFGTDGGVTLITATGITQAITNADTTANYRVVLYRLK